MEHYEVIKQQIELLKIKMYFEIIKIVFTLVFWYLINKLIDFMLLNVSTTSNLKLILVFVFLFILSAFAWKLLKIMRRINILYKKYMKLISEKAYKDWIYN